MGDARWRIAGRQVACEAAADYLLNGYPRLTLVHYDCAGESPRDRLTMADIGRASLFGAFRGWKAVAKMVRAAEEAAWPEAPSDWKLGDAPSSSPVEWLSTPEVSDARDLFSSLAGGEAGGWREAATSKLLHLKWPEFFPVIDGELRSLYGEPAMAFQRQMPDNRRRAHATTWAYWMAVRQDLLSPQNTQAEQATRHALAAGDHGPHDEKAGLLRKLTSLRMLDVLAWAVASEDLAAS